MKVRFDAARWPLALAVSAGLHAVVFLALPEPPQAPVLQDWGALVMVEWPEPVWITEPPRKSPATVAASKPGTGGTGPAPRNRPTRPAPAAEAPPIAAPGRAEEASGDVVLRVGAPLRVGTAAPAGVGGTAEGSEAVLPPRCRPPPVAVPATVRKAQLEGVVGLSLTIQATGRVSNIVVTTSLRDDADQACVEAWSKARCRPGQRNGEPVRVVDVPFSCRFEQRAER
ncbi:MAG: TonB family protein [Myxococcota bacterium]